VGWGMLVLVAVGLLSRVPVFSAVLPGLHGAIQDFCARNNIEAYSRLVYQAKYDLSTLVLVPHTP
jgi:hypothetical protein